MQWLITKVIIKASEILSDEDRVEQGLSTHFFKKSQYDKIVLSLLSPLPNEQVCKKSYVE